MMTNPEKRAGPPPIFDTPATPSISDALSRVRHEELPPPRIVSPMTQGLGPDTGRGTSRRQRREPRTEPMSCRVTPAEKARINAFLDANGLSLPDAIILLLNRHDKARGGEGALR